MLLISEVTITPTTIWCRSRTHKLLLTQPNNSPQNWSKDTLNNSRYVIINYHIIYTLRIYLNFILIYQCFIFDNILIFVDLVQLWSKKNSNLQFGASRLRTIRAGLESTYEWIFLYGLIRKHCRSALQRQAEATYRHSQHQSTRCPIYLDKRYHCVTIRYFSTRYIYIYIYVKISKHYIYIYRNMFNLIINVIYLIFL